MHRLKSRTQDAEALREGTTYYSSRSQGGKVDKISQGAHCVSPGTTRFQERGSVHSGLHLSGWVSGRAGCLLWAACLPAPPPCLRAGLADPSNCHCLCHLLGTKDLLPQGPPTRPGTSAAEAGSGGRALPPLQLLLKEPVLLWRQSKYSRVEFVSLPSQQGVDIGVKLQLRRPPPWGKDATGEDGVHFASPGSPSLFPLETFRLCSSMSSPIIITTLS